MPEGSLAAHPVVVLSVSRLPIFTLLKFSRSQCVFTEERRDNGESNYPTVAIYKH